MIHVHGYSGSFDDETRALAGEVALVMGGHRHLDALGVDPDRRVRLGAITPALERLRELPEGADALVVASGDPGFHGVLRRIRLEGWPVTVRPAPTSVSLPFAPVGLPWAGRARACAHRGRGPRHDRRA